MTDDHEGFYSGKNRTPIPDPTSLTTEQLNRMESTIRNLINVEILHQKELFNEELKRLELQFKMLEDRTAEQKQDTKSALDAALAAQKEAVASQTASSEKAITKSETASLERIKGVEALLSTSTKAYDDKIGDVKDRVIAIEAVKLGSTEAGTTARTLVADSRSGRDSLVGILVAVAIVVIPITVFLASHFK
ncbi:MAG: hypothetical protein NVSMB52_20400 [Chloroflexota bacterium]